MYYVLSVVHTNNNKLNTEYAVASTFSALENL